VRSINIYKVLWAKIGGRPWTYILRDAWDDYEFFWIVGLVSLGIWLGHIFTWQAVLKGWLIFSVGYIAGHLFWGTPHIPGQGGDKLEGGKEP
jgi:hypothetical protein